jgi:phosphohistidine phosphatase
MKTLILMRHAKSSWNDPDLADHERPLNDRGRKSARLLGDWLRRKGHLPDQVLTSDSVRTRETLIGLRLEAPTKVTRKLYHADPATMASVLRQASGDRVLMLGHNPGIAEFAAYILRVPPSEPQFFRYPTCATLVARFPYAAWSELQWSQGEALDFVVPRDLAASPG